MFEFEFTNLAKEQLRDLKHNKGLTKRYKAVLSALAKLQNNPKHPSLNTHLYESLRGLNGEKIFEAYAENNTPVAYRIFFHYGPDKKFITIYSIQPHP
ncbi:MAG: hypothetical protein KAS87_05410 [Candidatus Omnitrophica bacterium]|nr:hypothetical protein [Candidatus Omnitrophota bacterium]